MNRWIGTGWVSLLVSAVLCTGVPQCRAGAATEQFKPDRTVVYKEIDGVELRMHLFLPEGHSADDRRPAIVFFFGGGWVGGSPQQFFPHCAYLASRGMVAASAEYRVKSRHGVTPDACVRDGKSAVRWLRAHADELGIDPERLAAGGGSAGGHVAACTGLIEDFKEDETGEAAAVSSQPDALVLFNPVVVLADLGENLELGFGRQEKLKERGIEDPESISPAHHIDQKEPPTIVFHGTKDTTVPFRTIEVFCRMMKENDNRCEVVAFEGKPHGFFNFGRDGNGPFVETVTAMDRFLVSLKWLEGEADVQQWLETAATE